MHLIACSDCTLVLFHVPFTNTGPRTASGIAVPVDLARSIVVYLRLDYAIKSQALAALSGNYTVHVCTREAVTGVCGTESTPRVSPTKEKTAEALIVSEPLCSVRSGFFHLQSCVDVNVCRCW